jgi:hypothetical protein
MAENDSGRPASRWNIAVWGTATLLLLLPLLAMQVTDDLDWDVADFAVFAAMLIAAGGMYELAARKSGNTAYRTGVGLALAAAFILIWMNLAVGIIGSEDNPANLMYGGVLAVGIIGAIIAHFQPQGMARTLVAMALTQTLVGVIAGISGSESTGANWPGVIVCLNVCFAMLWLVSAWLFRKAAQEHTSTGYVP